MQTSARHFIEISCVHKSSAEKKAAPEHCTIQIQLKSGVIESSVESGLKRSKEQ